mmetsp:Transcript_26000/g.38204  ORF Transcript_26000/g.38204 Transcript_26000/m.38204 type:complete len:166 (-) Transcript_26000:274-771(-)
MGKDSGLRPPPCGSICEMCGFFGGPGEAKSCSKGSCCPCLFLAAALGWSEAMRAGRLLCPVAALAVPVDARCRKCCSDGCPAWWVVEHNGDGNGGPPGIRLVHVVLLVPAGPSAAVVAPEWVCMSRGAKYSFAAVFARGSCWNACDADGRWPGRCCASFLESISC